MSYGMNNASGSVRGENVPSGYEKSSVKTFTPEMMKLWKSMFPHLGPDSDLAKLAGGDESMFEQMEAPAHRQFQELQGGLASRFSGSGMGARRGSGFQNGMNQATSSFAQDLQSNRQGLQRQALGDLMNYSNQLLGQNPYETSLVQKQQKQQSPWANIAGKFASAIPGAVAGFALGGPPGALAAGGYNFANEMQSGSGYNY